MKKFLILLLFLLILGCDNSPQKVNSPNEFIAKVIEVKNGDTIEVLYNNKPAAYFLQIKRKQQDKITL